MIVKSFTGKAAEELMKHLRPSEMPEGLASDVDAWVDEYGWIYIRYQRAVGDHYELSRIDATDIREDWTLYAGRNK